MRQPSIKILLATIIAIVALWFLNSFLNARPDVSESLKELKAENILVLNQKEDKFYFYQITEIKDGVVHTKAAITYVEDDKIPTPEELKKYRSGILDFFEGEARSFSSAQIDSLRTNKILVDIFK